MIITEYYQYKELLARMNRDECILIPIFRDPYYHRMQNNILCVGITFANLDTYIISISHEDAPQFEMPSGQKIFSDIDINILAYVNNITPPKIEYSSYITNTHNQFQVVRDTNKIIPLVTWGKCLREHNIQLMKIFTQYRHTLDTPAYRFTKNLSDTLKRIESSGLKVNTMELGVHYGSKVGRYFKNDMVYSEYNIFTTTGRPSNRFGGINFSALNKSDGSRDAFISRYPDGVLVQFDFEAYHLRLIADEHGFELPTDSLHTELAKKYFNTDDITEELYAASKQKTFEIIYGLSDETYGIPLFERIVNMRGLFKDVVGPMVLPSGVEVHIKENTASKKFNYHIQSLEIVKTLPKLQKVLDLLSNTPNHLILYTYDSILLDMKDFDKEIIRNITSILEENKKFPVRVYAGNTYGNIQEMSTNIFTR